MMEELLNRYPALSVCRASIEEVTARLIEAFRAGNKLLVCGNGGSCADSDHIVGELMKGFLSLRPLSDEKKKMMRRKNPRLSDEMLSKLQRAVPAISLPSLTALNTAFANDVDPALVYAQELMGLGKPGDILLCLSTSGNAKNCVAAAEVACGLGMTVIGMTGADGGKLRKIADVCICAPETETFKVQELHLPIYHAICIAVEAAMFQS